MRLGRREGGGCGGGRGATLLAVEAGGSVWVTRGAVVTGHCGDSLWPAHPPSRRRAAPGEVVEALRCPTVPGHTGGQPEGQAGRPGVSLPLGAEAAGRQQLADGESLFLPPGRPGLAAVSQQPLSLCPVTLLSRLHQLPEGHPLAWTLAAPLLGPCLPCLFPGPQPPCALGPALPHLTVLDKWLLPEAVAPKVLPPEFS